MLPEAGGGALDDGALAAPVLHARQNLRTAAGTRWAARARTRCPCHRFCAEPGGRRHLPERHRGRCQDGHREGNARPLEGSQRRWRCSLSAGHSTRPIDPGWLPRLRLKWRARPGAAPCAWRARWVWTGPPGTCPGTAPGGTAVRSPCRHQGPTHWAPRPAHFLEFLRERHPGISGRQLCTIAEPAGAERLHRRQTCMLPALHAHMHTLHQSMRECAGPDQVDTAVGVGA